MEDATLVCGKTSAFFKYKPSCICKVPHEEVPSEEVLAHDETAIVAARLFKSPSENEAADAEVRLIIEHAQEQARLEHERARRCIFVPISLAFSRAKSELPQAVAGGISEIKLFLAKNSFYTVSSEFLLHAKTYETAKYLLNEGADDSKLKKRNLITQVVLRYDYESGLVNLYRGYGCSLAELSPYQDGGVLVRPIVHLILRAAEYVRNGFCGNLYEKLRQFLHGKKYFELTANEACTLLGFGKEYEAIVKEEVSLHKVLAIKQQKSSGDLSTAYEKMYDDVKAARKRLGY